MPTVHSRNATALATLRIFVGIFFLLFGEYEVFGTEFTLHGGFEESIRSFPAQGMYPWMAPVLRHIVCPTRTCMHS
jgi:thiosulfate dehydrogenase [quinone] large subunit